MDKHKIVSPLALAIALTTIPLWSQANTCEPAAGKFVSLEGSVEVAHAEQSQWDYATPTTRLCEGDSIRVGSRGRAAIQLANDAVLRLDQNTTMRLVDVVVKAGDPTLLELVVGAFKSFSRAPRTMTVSTPYVNGMIEGTEFSMRVADKAAQVSVFEGKIRTANAFGEVTLTHGQSAAITAGSAPRLETLVNQNDSVQWALYYPPLLAALGGSSNSQPAVAAALASASKGDATGALATLDALPAGTRTAASHTLRASLLLNVGQVGEARAAIDAALAVEANAGPALALRAMIEVVQNQREQALADAQAAKAKGGGAAASIALSYALQSTFKLDAAREEMLSAAAAFPDNALVQARLAELWLMNGERSKALEAAHRAETLAPDLAKPQLVLGFAELAANRAPDAAARFRRAVEGASADPLAHFGLGLALIKQGQLTDGRRELEAAVALDGSNALLRPYLGKAYYEEKRSPLDAQQYRIAQELDPADPTAFLYEAIRKQTDNQPVGALHDLQKAIALNDNRAVYRSRQLLDSDQASRGASIARIYSDLGFEQRALAEGWKSVNLDPGNFSAHRFLADSYASRPRHEIARVSELLQSQLLQPLSSSPIQPRLAESNLGLISSGGPGAVGFNEFNRIFTRDGFSVQGSTVIGEHDTYAGEGVVSGIIGKTAFSLGGFHYETDGYRKNSDQRDDMANAFVQYELSSETSVQAEYRHRDSLRGDLAQRFFKDNYFPGERHDDIKDSYRIGMRHEFSPNSTLLGSFMYQEAEFRTVDRAPPALPPPVNLYLIDLMLPTQAFGTEIQHLFRSRFVSVTSGVGFFDINAQNNQQVGVELNVPPFIRFPPSFSTQDLDTRHVNAYVYSYLHPFENVVVTVAGSGDFIESDYELTGTQNHLNPKLGVTWEPRPGTVLRAAGFRTFKRTLITDQTLEPTQVAGFNQFFDDINGTLAWRYGGGLDQQLGATLFAGAEITKGDLSVPYQDNSQFPAVTYRSSAWDEGQARAYLFWTPLDWLALRSEYQYEYNTENLQANPDRPFINFRAMDTQRVPLSASVFLPEGFSGNVRGTYVHQHGSFVDVSGACCRAGDSDFMLLDASVSYRLPKRYGIVSVAGTNLTDRRYNYFDFDFRNPMFQPSRAVFARITLSFP